MTNETLDIAGALLLFGKIDTEMSNKVWETLTQAEYEEDNSIGFGQRADSPEIPPQLIIINSDGGDMNDALSIIDAINAYGGPVITMGTGVVASGAVLLLAAGDHGYRYCLPNTRLMLHPTSWTDRADYASMCFSVQEADTMQKLFFSLLVEFSNGENHDEISKLISTPGDKYFSPERALELGLIDNVSYSLRCMGNEEL